jgi:hypothetical protein
MAAATAPVCIYIPVPEAMTMMAYEGEGIPANGTSPSTIRRTGGRSSRGCARETRSAWSPKWTASP